jgi:hypothetical protein
MQKSRHPKKIRVRWNRALRGAVASALTGALTSGVTACAGPATPLGALWSVRADRPIDQISDENERQNSVARTDDQAPRVRFQPRRQVLHSKRTVKIWIEDPLADVKGDSLAVFYDGLDVTQSVLNQATLHKSRFREGSSKTRRATERWMLEIPDIRLSPDQLEHRIEVAYRSPSGKLTQARFRGPQCSLAEDKAVVRTEAFNPSPRLLKLIASLSKTEGFNPAFATGLIAQESSFQSRQISWARAIGLTQVTPLAEMDLREHYPEWPRYPELNELPIGKVKLMIMNGQVNASNEWRLNPEHSIRGGLAYLQILDRRWSKPENAALISAIFKDSEKARTQLLLASYNSGYNRVLSSLQRNGKGWLNSPELKEARKYVNRIFSFCDHFSEKDDEDEIQT